MARRLIVVSNRLPIVVEQKEKGQRLKAGTGSHGAARYYVLIESGGGHAEDDMILDIKQQLKPTPYHFLGADRQAEYDQNFLHDAERHAHAFRALTNIKNAQGRITFADNYLGWMELPDGVYSVRKRSPFKKAFPTQKLNKEKRLKEMAEQWGMILATAHARAHYFEHQLLPVPFAGPVLELTAGRGKIFQDLVVNLAISYADQVEADWALFNEKLAPKN